MVMEPTAEEAILRILELLESLQGQINTIDQHYTVLRDKLQAVCLVVGALDNLPDGSLRDRIHSLEVINGMDPADDEILPALEGVNKES